MCRHADPALPPPGPRGERPRPPGGAHAHRRGAARAGAASHPRVLCAVLRLPRGERAQAQDPGEARGRHERATGTPGDAGLRVLALAPGVCGARRADHNADRAEDIVGGGCLPARPGEDVGLQVRGARLRGRGGTADAAAEAAAERRQRARVRATTSCSLPGGPRGPHRPCVRRVDHRAVPARGAAAGTRRRPPDGQDLLVGATGGQAADLGPRPEGVGVPPAEL
mmetsp:Transcript_93769/g.265133  ORF Transcript_93769/g.265133 Transcript_93769/m.265133 type:complete len:225 (+) Transcript_93769:1019-1693(+)